MRDHLVGLGEKRLLECILQPALYFFIKSFPQCKKKKFGSVNYYLYLCSIMTKDLSILSPLIILMAISVTVCVYQVSIIIFSDNKKISKWLNDLIK